MSRLDSARQGAMENVIVIVIYSGCCGCVSVKCHLGFSGFNDAGVIFTVPIMCHETEQQLSFFPV